MSLVLVTVLFSIAAAISARQNNTDTAESVQTSTVPAVVFNRMTSKKVDGDLEAAALEKNTIEEVKKDLDRAVQGVNGAVSESNAKVSNAIGDIAGSLNICTALECNNRGACIGTKTAHICACLLGYSGRNCEETLCNSTRDCNGRGLCFGTTTSLTCLCNFGFTGPRCEKQV